MSLMRPLATGPTFPAANDPRPPVLPRSRIAALVVTHNRLDQLRRTVARLLEEPIDHLIVVDNASTDGTALWLKSEADPLLHIVRAPRNAGGAGGFEQGLAEVTRTFDPDWCVLMDDDARPEPGMIARFRLGLAGQTKGWQAISAGVFYPDGRICEMNRPSLNPFWHVKSLIRTALGGGRRGFHLSDEAYDARAPRQVDSASFVGLFLSRAALARGGLPDGRLFLYGDDLIYTLGLTQAGTRIGFAPWLRWEHDCSTFERDERAGTRLYRPLWKAYYNYRNGILGYRKIAGPVLFWPVLALMAPRWFLRSRAYGPQARVFRALLALALRDALAGRFDRPHYEILARAMDDR